MILFDQLSREQGILAKHISYGQSVELGPDALLADLSEPKPVFQCMAPGHPFCAPSKGRWYAISTRRFPMRLGLRDLVQYRLEGCEDHQFRLGFVGSMELQTAHVQGLQRLIGERDCMTYRIMYEALYEIMRSAVCEEVRRALPEHPFYSDCIASKRKLEERIGSRLFRLLLVHGLYMPPECFRIEGFAKPYITI